MADATPAADPRQLALPHTDRPPVGGRATVDVSSCVVRCDRCGASHESKSLDALLTWQRSHTAECAAKAGAR